MRLRKLAVTIGFVVAAATSTAAHGSPAPGSPTPGTDSAAPATAAATAAADLSSRAAGNPAYAGIRVTDDGATVELFATRPDAALTDLVRAQRRPTKVTIVGHSYAELTAVADRITRDVEPLAAGGLDLVSWGPDDGRNDVVVELGTPNAQAAGLLRARYGDLVRVVDGRRPHRTASRLNDDAPWNGGDFIAMDNGHDCTSGPPVVRPSTGQRYLLTAGHCFTGPTGGLTGFSYRVFQGAHTMPGGGGVNPMIGLAAAELQNNGYDDALIQANASTLNWRTQRANDAGVGVHQVVAAGAVQGAPVCASGAFSGERCGATVLRVNQNVRIDGIVSIHMVQAQNRGVALIGHGDSGGPVYQVHGSGLFVVGIITALADETRIGSPRTDLPCPQNDQAGRGSTCSDTVWFEDVPSILNHLGVRLNV